jgi:uncharacterized protein YecE (DUF72 family)
VTRFHVAAREVRGKISTYAKAFEFAEITVEAAAAAREERASSADATRGKDVETQPTLATLRRWRKQVPPAFDFTVVAGPSLSRMRPGQALDRDLAALKRAVVALRARTILVRTVADVTPAPLWRERMAKVFDRLPRDATRVAWEPSGLWEQEDAARCADRWGVMLVVDAARVSAPAGPVVYTRLRGLGETRSFGPAALERVVAGIGERRDVWVVLETPGAKTEAKRLHEVASRAERGGASAMGRILRPRGSLAVRDDEQE